MNKLKMNLEAKKREAEQLLAELEGQRDVARDAERRSVQNRDSLRVVQRELDNLKGERTLGADRLGQVENDARLAEQDLKERLLQKEQLLLEAQRQVEWMEEQSATKFTAMAREKEDLVAELGIRSSSLSGDGRESGGKKVGKSGGGARRAGGGARSKAARGLVAAEVEDRVRGEASAANAAPERPRHMAMSASAPAFDDDDMAEQARPSVGAAPRRKAAAAAAPPPDEGADHDLIAEVQAHLAARAAAGDAGLLPTPRGGDRDRGAPSGPSGVAASQAGLNTGATVGGSLSPAGPNITNTAASIQSTSDFLAKRRKRKGGGGGAKAAGEDDARLYLPRLGRE